MDLQISVFLLFILFTAGHSLSCYECRSSLGSCAFQEKKTCPSESLYCVSTTGVVQIGGIKTVNKFKGCEADCQSGSTNIGYSKMTLSCCNTDLCNAQDAPDPNTNVPNGKKCFSCDEKSCSNTLSCLGTEDRCFKATGENLEKDLTTVGGLSVVSKGCISKNICDVTAAGTLIPNVKDFSCCEGNMCNGAQSVSQSFLFLCCSLLSYFLLQ
ncbi:phospholipase A2 inhibitor and Ly6/PLAUR domain-containing protein [Anabarilius grahami]|uniref:Phospholipase A2 inhibitor and Ly6/PLAUR domain-containing protein n=1 Tax=Anabarilius grahami TaxID=495550 RepID=A0A3N0YBP6_ANAGA|nr:phospholipase A2 inhibitor and Ly6/PLAUR domain-containing protein [Anabarilius grahami]